jgi:DENN domain-containing protein 11
MLQEHWEKNKIREGNPGEDANGESPIPASRPKSSPQLNGYRRPRAISDATAMMSPNQTLSPHHPAISLPEFISYFGPLIFPLYRAALLRKRILMVGEPPVEQNCDFGMANSPVHSLFADKSLSTISLSCPQYHLPSFLSYQWMAYHHYASVLSSTSAFKTFQSYNSLPNTNQTRALPPPISHPAG